MWRRHCTAQISEGETRVRWHTSTVIRYHILKFGTLCDVDGQACLATLVRLANNEARIAAQISQEGGVLLAVRLLKSPATPDKKLVIQLLTLLAEKCPLHQQEVVSNGAVPVLVDLLFSEEAICSAAYQVNHSSIIIIEPSLMRMWCVTGVVVLGFAVSGRE